MTDLQTYTKDDGRVLLSIHPDWRSANNGKLLVKLPIVTDAETVVIPTARLLAMIDRADPDAMRAYLRETVAPVCKYGCPPGCDAVPEADSPEDVDERPTDEPGTFDTAGGRLFLIDHLAALYPSGTPDQIRVAAQWITAGQQR